MLRIFLGSGRVFFDLPRALSSSVLHTPEIKFGNKDPAFDERDRFLQEQLPIEVLVKLLG